MSVVIRAEDISKQYRLGEVGTGAMAHDVNRWGARVRGKEDPYLKIGETNDRTAKRNNEYVWALKDINFDVHQGEVLGIIGRNGAGKSTLLKILSRTTTPTTGSIKIKGRVASLLEVGTGFHPELTGRDNIFLNGTILGMTKNEIKRKFDEIVDFAGVERYIDTPVKRYSSGMYVRLAFGVAAHLEPEILIVDEVLAVGDAEFQKKALGKMKDVSTKDGRTVLFVSHNMSAVKELCSTGLLLNHGTVEPKSDIEEIIRKYLLQSSSNAFYNRTENSNSAGFFLSVALRDENSKVTNSFSGSSLPNIYLEYSLSKDVSNFNVGFIVTDLFGTLIYASADTDSNDILLERRMRGNYKLTVPLPLLNLNTGDYQIKFLMGIVNVDLFDSCELSFSVQNNNFLNSGNRPGLLLTKIDWIYF